MGKITKGVLAVCVLVPGCGGSQPKPAAAGRTPEPTVIAEALPDLSPVKAPADLVAVGRLKNPAEFLDRLTSWSKLPVDWRTILAKEEPSVDRVLKLDAPIDVAAELNPAPSMTPRAPFMVVSLGLSSFDGALEFARSKSEVVRPLANGMYGLGDPPHRCVIARAAGAAPARLVCGNKPADIEALAPYVTRGMPVEAIGSADLHFELRGAPARARYHRELEQLKALVPVALTHLALDVPRVDRALGDALYGVADELVSVANDFQKFDFDVTLLGDVHAVELRFDAELQPQTSWLAQTALTRRTGPAPDEFWSLPQDSTSAAFAYMPGPERYAGIRKTLAELLDGLLEYEKAPRSIRDQVTDVITESFKTDAAWATAEGSLPEPPETASIAGADRDRERIRRRIGWHIGAAAAKSEPYVADFNKLVRLYNDRQLRALLEKRAKIKMNDWPAIRQRAPRGAGLGPRAVAFELTLPGSLFDDDLADVLKLKERGPVPGKKPPGRAPAKSKPLSVVLLIVPDGERTWFGLSTDEKILSERIAKLKSKSGETLAGRADLAQLKSAQAMGGGFLSIARLAANLGELRSSALTPNRILTLLPHHGETAIPFEATTGKATKGAARLNWSLRLPNATLEDLGALLPVAGAIEEGHD